VTGNILPGTSFSRGQVVTVVATPDDGSLSGAPVVGNSVTIQNAPPTAPVVSITPANPQDADDLVCSVTTQSTDADGDSITYDFTWTKNGQAFSGASSTSATSSTVSAGDTSPTDTFRCLVSTLDGASASTAAAVAATVGSTLLQTGFADFNTGSLAPFTLAHGCAGYGCPSASGGSLNIPADWNSLVAPSNLITGTRFAFEFKVITPGKLSVLAFVGLPGIRNGTLCDVDGLNCQSTRIPMSGDTWRLEVDMPTRTYRVALNGVEVFAVPNAFSSGANALGVFFGTSDGSRANAVVDDIRWYSAP
jgi:hypothetical protein